MSNVPRSFNLVQQEALQYNNPTSESSMASMAAPINGLLQIMAPVGTIWSSMLTESQFIAQLGTPSPVTWILCDGRDISGSAYADVTGNTFAPDARGISLRGKNDGRADGNQNPDGELPLGTYSAGRNASHNHAITDPGHSHQYSQGGFGGDNKVSAFPGTYGNNGDGTIGSPRVNTDFTAITIQNQGGGDTAPKNITINWFIRIN